MKYDYDWYMAYLQALYDVRNRMVDRPFFLWRPFLRREVKRIDFMMDATKATIATIMAHDDRFKESKE